MLIAQQLKALFGINWVQIYDELVPGSFDLIFFLRLQSIQEVFLQKSMG
jgi:hypothetical protein